MSELISALPEMTPEAAALYASVVTAFKPPLDLPLSEWSRQYFRLENGASFEPLPYQVGILDALTDVNTRTVVFQKSARVGGTLTSVAFMAHEISQGKSTASVQPRAEDASDFSVSDVAPALRSCPLTADLTTGKGTRETITQKTFSNGAVYRSLAAGSPQGARRISVDSLFMDEISGWDESLGEEGQPTQLFIKRTGASANPTIYACSTPTMTHNDEIVRMYKTGNQQVFRCECPECGHKAELQFEQLTINGKRVHEFTKAEAKDLPADFQVEYLCEDCGSFWPETKKREVVATGEWHATAVGDPSVQSFRISALVSPFTMAAWTQISREYFDSIGDPSLSRVFQNTVLGRPVDANAFADLTPEKVKQNAVERVDPIPASILRLVAGADVGRDHIECTILGSGPDEWRVIDHRRLMGDPTNPQLWMDLEGYLNETRQSALGGVFYGVAAAAIDSGAFTQTVYEEASKRQHWFSVKGAAGRGKPAWTQSKTKASKLWNAKLHIVGVDAAKEWIMTKLAAGAEDEMPLLYPDDLHPSWYEQVVGEVLELQLRSGRLVPVWKPRGAGRVEALDTLAYSWAISHGVMESWEQRRADLTTHPTDKPRESGFAALGRRYANRDDRYL